MTAALHTFTAEQGATFTRTTGQEIDGTPTDFTGYSGKMQVRDKAGTVVIELSTSNGRISISGTSITLTITATDTAALPVGSFRYDLFLTASNGAVTRLLYGVFDVLERVTQ